MGFERKASWDYHVPGMLLTVRICCCPLQTFTKLLQRPDGRAALVTQFQQQYNALDVDARKLKETQVCGCV